MRPVALLFGQNFRSSPSRCVPCQAPSEILIACCPRRLPQAPTDEARESLRSFLEDKRIYLEPGQGREFTLHWGVEVGNLLGLKRLMPPEALELGRHREGLFETSGCGGRI